jgi:hypothetical protein
LFKNKNKKQEKIARPICLYFKNFIPKNALTTHKACCIKNFSLCVVRNQALYNFKFIFIEHYRKKIESELGGNKKKQAYKPDSVLTEVNFYHLSGLSVAKKNERPTPRHQSSKP